MVEAETFVQEVRAMREPHRWPELPAPGRNAPTR